jgi:ABC-type uncharacterized transport system permease subunit
MYQTVIILKAIVEIAGLALFGQGLLFVLAGKYRHQNMFYTILKTITSPVFKATRFIAPRFIVDQHIGFLAFFLLMVLWLALTIAKIRMVLTAA